MLDFRKKDLWNIEVGEFNRFINKVLQTNEEYMENERFHEGDDEFEEIETLDGLQTQSLEDFNNSPSYQNIFDEDEDGQLDYGGLGGNPDYEDIDLSNQQRSKLSEIEQDNKWDGYDGFKKLLTSYFYVMNASWNLIINVKPTKSEMSRFLPEFFRFNSILLIISIFMIILKVNLVIFDPLITIIFHALSMVTCFFIGKTVFKKNIIFEAFNITPKEDDSIEEEETVEEEDNDIASETPDFMSSSFLNSNDDNDVIEDGAFDVEDDEYDNDSKFNHYPESPIICNDTFEKFEKSLGQAWLESAKYIGTAEERDREFLIKSYASYLPSNTENFGQFRNLNPEKIEYKNIAYAIYSGIVKACGENSFDYGRFTVLSAQKSPAIYNIECKLPKSINKGRIQKNLNEFLNIFKSNSEDTNVGVSIEAVGSVLIFRVPNVELKNAISIGDILRFTGAKYKGKNALEQLSDNTIGVPILMGLMEKQFPNVFDLEENTHMIVAGGSGSGKSWSTFPLATYITMANSYKDLNMIIFDVKNAPNWNTFGKTPHVIAHHSNAEKILSTIIELDNEAQRRQEMLSEEGIEDIKQYREYYKEKAMAGDEEARIKLESMPLIVVIFDEFTSFYSMIRDLGEDDKLKNHLGNIARLGRSAGVKVIYIGQYTTQESFPEYVKKNITINFGMKLSSNAEYERLFGSSIKHETKPINRGDGLFNSEEDERPRMTTSAILGGKGAKGNMQLSNIINVIALENVRRTFDTEFDPSDYPDSALSESSLNRVERYNKAIEEIKIGKITTVGKKENPKYAFDPNNLNRPQYSNHQHFAQEDTSKDIIVNQNDDEDESSEMFFSQDDYSNFDDILNDIEIGDTNNDVSIYNPDDDEDDNYESYSLPSDIFSSNEIDESDFDFNNGLEDIENENMYQENELDNNTNILNNEQYKENDFDEDISSMSISTSNLNDSIEEEEENLTLNDLFNSPMEDNKDVQQSVEIEDSDIDDSNSISQYILSHGETFGRSGRMKRIPSKAVKEVFSEVDIQRSIKTGNISKIKENNMVFYVIK